MTNLAENFYLTGKKITAEILTGSDQCFVNSICRTVGERVEFYCD